MWMNEVDHCSTQATNKQIAMVRNDSVKSFFKKGLWNIQAFFHFFRNKKAVVELFFFTQQTTRLFLKPLFPSFSSYSHWLLLSSNSYPHHWCTIRNYCFYFVFVDLSFFSFFLHFVKFFNPFNPFSFRVYSLHIIS